MTTSRVTQLAVPTSAPILLRGEGLSKSFGGQVVFRNISFELHRGEVVLLRGENGSGKTTLLNVITGNLEPDCGFLRLCTADQPAILHFPRRWWQRLNLFDQFTPESFAKYGVGRTWQDIRLFHTQNLRDNIAVATPEQIGENPAWVVLRQPEVRQQERVVLASAEQSLISLGLGERTLSSADKISLGQSKRVAIARAVSGRLADDWEQQRGNNMLSRFIREARTRLKIARAIHAGAQILCLDEPLAGLDAAGAREVLSLITSLVRDRQVTLVIIEHVFNIPRILDLATTVWTLESYGLTTESAVEVREHLRGIGRGVQVDFPESNELEWAREAGLLQRAEIASSSLDLSSGARLSTLIAPNNSHLNDPPALEVEDLVVRRGARLVIGDQMADGSLRGVSFTLRTGELAVLQAPNGWGKTTLLQALTGLLPIVQGKIRLYGRDIQDLMPWERSRLGLAHLQAQNNSFPGLTVAEALHLSGSSLDGPLAADIAPLLPRRMSALSGGEKQKVALACALQSNRARVGLLDEPFSTLDHASIHRASLVLLAHLHHGTLLVAVPSQILEADQAASSYQLGNHNLTVASPPVSNERAMRLRSLTEE
jgi:branched-chain amino acid transport system ATP-binding protein